LENTYTAVLSCTHACCLPCLDEYKDLTRRVGELQRYQILAAHKNARDEIFNSISSAGGMGRESEFGVLHIDFHALHVDEAKTKFDEDVMPVLPVVKTMLLIVGAGSQQRWRRGETQVIDPKSH
jgi:hypothetical protein